MSRKSNTQARRAQIIEAFLQVLAHKGYAAATIQEIAAAAELTPGLLHYHFKTKQEMLTVLLAQLAAQADARYRQKREAAQGPRARLRAFIDAHLALGEDARPELVRAWVVLGSEAVRAPEVRAIYTDTVRLRLEEAARLLRDALPAEAQPTVEHVAAGLLAMIEGSFTLAAATDHLLPVGFAADAAWRFIEPLLLPEPAA